MNNRSQRAWMWVAVAALAVSMLARAQSGVYAARAYASPIFEAFAEYQAAADHEASAHAGSTQRSVSRHDSSAGQQFVAGLLPVLFVGLLLPLTVLRKGSARTTGNTPSSLTRPFLFQRPPPSATL